MNSFLEARDFFLAHRTDYAAAVSGFRWPALTHFNWALDYFDVIAAGNHAPALHIVEEDGRETVRSFAGSCRRLEPRRQLPALARRPARRSPAADARQRRRAVGDPARLHEARRRHHAGDNAADGGGSAGPRRPRPRPARRRRRGGVEKFDGVRGAFTKIVVGGEASGWQPYDDHRQASATFEPATANPGRRSAAALLHVGHHRTAEARDAHASELSGRPSLDAVLDRAAAGRSPLEHQLARLGQARVELCLRAVECAGDGVHLQLRAVQRDARCSAPSPRTA